MLHGHWRVAIALLALEAGLYCLLAVRPFSLQYVDYVDGYYLYVAHRVAQGAVLYRDVQGVQPPLIFVVGAVLFRLHNSLALLRLYALAVHLAIQGLVFLAGLKLYRRFDAALVGATLFALAPYSLQWDRIFDPNPLVTLLSLASVFALLFEGRAAALAGGALGALALVTKVWYLPVLVVSVLYLARHQPARLPRFLLGLAGVLLLVCGVGWVVVGASFWQGLLAQDVSPIDLAWFDASVTHVLLDDTPLLLAALVGFMTIASARIRVNPLVSGYGLSSCLVLGATVKQGTAWPVFQFAEPSLALLATACLVPLLSHDWTHQSQVSVLARLAAPCFIAIVAIWSIPAMRAAFPASDGSERTVTQAMRTYSRPAAMLLAPPFYLYLTERRAYAEEADVNLWDLADRSGDAAAMTARARLVAQLDRGAIAVVVIDQRVARLRGVMPALLSHYSATPFHDPVPVDRAVQIWLPRSPRDDLQAH